MELEIQLPYMNPNCPGSEIKVIGENEVYYKVHFDNESAARRLLKELQAKFPAKIVKPMEMSATELLNAMKALPGAFQFRDGYRMNVMVIDLKGVDPLKEVPLVAEPTPQLEFEVRIATSGVGNYWHCLTPILITG